MIDIKLASKELKETMEGTLKKALEYAEDIKFQKTDLDFREFKKLDAKIEVLQNVVYIIVIKDNCEVSAKTVCEEISKFKKKKSQKIKFPKVNGSIDDMNRILYIGKSKNIIKNRFVSHLSSSSPSVYGLHLEHWLSNKKLENIELEMYFAEIPLKKEDVNSEILEILETCLHKKYKPILGRSGH